MDEQQIPFNSPNLTPTQAGNFKYWLKKYGPQVAQGTATVPGGSTAYAVPHGLKGIPQSVSISTNTVLSAGVIYTAFLSQSKATDATNIYFDSTGVSSRSVIWSAILFP